MDKLIGKVEELSVIDRDGVIVIDGSFFGDGLVMFPNSYSAINWALGTRNEYARIILGYYDEETITAVALSECCG